MSPATTRPSFRERGKKHGAWSSRLAIPRSDGLNGFLILPKKRNLWSFISFAGKLIWNKGDLWAVNSVMQGFWQMCLKLSFHLASPSPDRSSAHALAAFVSNTGLTELSLTSWPVRTGLSHQSSLFQPRHNTTASAPVILKRSPAGLLYRDTATTC